MVRNIRNHVAERLSNNQHPDDRADEYLNYVGDLVYGDFYRGEMSPEQLQNALNEMASNADVIREGEIPGQNPTK